MKFNKRFTLLMAFLLLAAASLSACGGNKPSTASNNDAKSSNHAANASEAKGSDKAGAVTLRFWSAHDPSTDQGRNIQQKVQEFNDSHDDIQVELQVISYDVLHEKLMVSINAGDMPDISWGLSEWFGEFNRLDILADLTPYMGQWEEKDQIYPNVLEALTVDGKLKALPNYLGIRALLYHEDLLKAAGYNEPPKTWDELLEMAPVVKEKTGKPLFGIAGTGVRSPQELIMYLAQNDVVLAEQQADGKFKNTWLDDPDQLARAAEVFKFYQDLVETGAVAQDARTWGWEEEDQNFVLAQYAMVVNGPWIEGRISENPEGMKDVKIAAPMYKKTPATFMEIAPLYIYKSDHLDATFEFAKFLLSKDYHSLVNPSNSPRMDVVSEGWGEDFMALTSQGVVFPTVSLGGITEAMEDALGLALLKKEDPAAVAQTLAGAINKSLEMTGELSGS